MGAHLLAADHLVLRSVRRSCRRRRRSGMPAPLPGKRDRIRSDRRTGGQDGRTRSKDDASHPVGNGRLGAARCLRGPCADGFFAYSKRKKEGHVL